MLREEELETLEADDLLDADEADDLLDALDADDLLEADEADDAELFDDALLGLLLLDSLLSTLWLDVDEGEELLLEDELLELVDSSSGCSNSSIYFSTINCILARKSLTEAEISNNACATYSNSSIFACGVVVGSLAILPMVSCNRV